jgi:hypothetical protein
MLIITTIADLYMISLFRGQRAAGLVCTFKKDFLTQQTWEHLDALPVFTLYKKPAFELTSKQDEELSAIMTKMKQEQGSGYIFSEDLQRTYLMELIHGILKVQLEN